MASESSFPLGIAFDHAAALWFTGLDERLFDRLVSEGKIKEDTREGRAAYLPDNLRTAVAELFDALGRTE